MEYFPLWYRFNSEDRYTIWISNDKDSLVVDADGFIPTFEGTDLLRRYADLSHFDLQNEEPILHDLDWIVTFGRAGERTCDCKKALAAWNLFVDVANSVGHKGNAFKRCDVQISPKVPRSSDPAPSIYNKLFWGNNLLPVTPDGCEYIPEWSSDELASLAELLSSGLDLFMSNTRNWPRI